MNTSVKSTITHKAIKKGELVKKKNIYEKQIDDRKRL